MLFFGSLPLRVDDVTVKAGDLTGPVMTVSNAQLAVDGGLSLNDAKLVRKGAAVTIDAADADFHRPGTVSEIAGHPARTVSILSATTSPSRSPRLHPPRSWALRWC